MATDITMTDLTNGTLDGNYLWSGSGIFDKLVVAVNKNIEAQYNLGRITGADYANVYLGGLQAVLAQSVQILLQEKQIEADIDIKKEQSAKDLLVKTQQIASMVADDSIKAAQSAKDLLLKQEQIDKLDYETSAVLPAQKDLIVRQKQGFDDDARQKLLKQTLDSWSVAYSVAQDANAIPDTIKVNVIDSITSSAFTSLGISKNTNPLGEP